MYALTMADRAKFEVDMDDTELLSTIMAECSTHPIGSTSYLICTTGGYLKIVTEKDHLAIDHIGGDNCVSKIQY